MVLPEGLKFLHFGWWLIHALAVLLVWGYAYRRGRMDERRDREREAERARRAAARKEPAA
jgi:hypothetical protein